MDASQINKDDGFALESVEHTGSEEGMMSCAVSQQASHAALNGHRVVWVDIAKGIAILLVIMGHTIQAGSPLIPMIFMFHMPLFFIMAGYTTKVKPLKEVVVSSAKRLLIPYVILFCIWNVVLWLQRSDALDPATINDFVLQFIFASGSENVDMGISAVGMAWFLMCLFMSKVVLSALLLLFKRYNCHNVIQLVIMILLAALGIVIGDYVHIFLPFDLDLVCVTVGFMWCGYKAREFNLVQSLGHRWYVVLLALLIYIAAFRFGYLELAVRAYDLAPLCILGALAGSLIACWASMLIERFSKILTKAFSFLGRNSMLIYCFHCIDWLIPWKSLAILEGVPFKGVIATVLRCAYDILLAVLVRRV